MFESRHNSLIIEFDPCSVIKKVFNTVVTVLPHRIAIDTVAFLFLVSDSNETIVMTSVQGPTVAQNGVQMVQIFS